MPGRFSLFVGSFGRIVAWLWVRAACGAHAQGGTLYYEVSMMTMC